MQVLIAGTPEPHPNTIYWMAGAGVIALLCAGLRLWMARLGVGKVARSLIVLAVFFPLLIAWGFIATWLWFR
jgi:hypothetical protein